MHLLIQVGVGTRFKLLQEQDASKVAKGFNPMLELSCTGKIEAFQVLAGSSSGCTAEPPRYDK